MVHFSFRERLLFLPSPPLQVRHNYCVAIRRVWGLSYNTHNLLLPLICCRLPLYDELMKRLLVFVQKFLTCDCELVTFVSRYAVWYGRMPSPIIRNVLHCSLRCGFVVRSVSELNCEVISNFYWQSVSRDDVDKARILLVIICSSGELSFV